MEKGNIAFNIFQDWHSDDEESLGKNPEIASLSFGETRMFELREIPKNVAVSRISYSSFLCACSAGR